MDFILGDERSLLRKNQKTHYAKNETMIVEVFKTNVQTRDEPYWLVERIQMLCVSYKANFDLGDCDRILRVKNPDGQVSTREIIRMMNNAGFHAEVLEDDAPVNQWCSPSFPKTSLLKLFELN
jgi:hypothetical protein